ncbi:AraC family transcriptional regulator [Rhizobium wenxiniae]|uniref:AraC-like DNA-binding protein n=1 Tax=Rhizobium wenxiniae TaxID=1737357 RepID=A0A7X0D175_9HYPH|nr:AraC family transcriptional regulator [Rhizobium wenxiniae]MBB6164094.1 AraC-like DNA-binding protein [Rhizobium wenxiniae]GGG04874.1 AraC family transcriptional regulator [Rhizobium wenxiniae]
MAETERHMIAPSFVEEALDSLRRSGRPTEPLLTGLGLPPAVTEPVSAQTFGQLWLAIAAELDDECFGLGDRPMQRGSFTLLCHCVLHAPTLERALRRALRFLNLVLGEPTGRLVVHDGIAEVQLSDEGEPRSAFAYRSYWIILHGLICWLVGRRIPIRLVDFRCTEPEQSADHRLFFGAPIRFSQSVSRLSFDAAMLALPISRNDQQLRQFLRGAPANILLRYRYDAGTAAAVRRRLTQKEPADWTSFATLATDMRMSSSTLRHRLHDEGQSYAGIKDEIRRDLACSLLTNTDQTVSEIATRLGYSEPSAFYRAFRKWIGLSPEAFRKSQTPK